MTGLPVKRSCSGRSSETKSWVVADFTAERAHTLEIGYWVHVDHLQKGYATEMARILTSAAFTVPGIERVEIHHDKANTRSGAIPRLSASD